MDKLVEWKTSKYYVDYESAVNTMQQRVTDIINNNAGSLIWFLEHKPLYSKGTSAKIDDLITPDRFPVYETGRGGQYTYHGPGQRVIYLVLDLKKFVGQDLKKYVCKLEQSVIDSLAHFGIKGERRQGRVGIWVKDQTNPNKEDKVAAIGIRVSKWVAYHGIAININPDLEHFSGIVPCGIKEHGVTSLKKLGKDVSLQEFDAIMKTNLIKNLNI